MSKTFLLFFITYVSIQSVISEEKCFRPEELKKEEEYCWKTQVEITERFVQTSKSVLNLAKKKLGIQVEEETEIQKCDYYSCILRQLNLLTANDYPAYENIKEWAKKNVVYFQALRLFDQLEICNSGLINSTVQETAFFADQIGVPSSVEVKKDDQSTCEIASEFINCLSRQTECPVFLFP